MTLFVVYYAIPQTNQPPSPMYPQTAPIKFTLYQLLNSSAGAMTNLRNSEIIIYKNGLLMEDTLAVNLLFTSSIAYTSGDVLFLSIKNSAYETLTTTVTIPYYGSANIILYHYLASVGMYLTPTLGVRTFLTGVQNSSSRWYTHSTSFTWQVQLYTVTPDAGTNPSWYDMIYAFARQYCVIFTLSGTNPSATIVNGLTWNIQAPTSGQNGIACIPCTSMIDYIVIPGQTNQQNCFTLSYTIATSGYAGNNNFSIQVVKNDDLAYHVAYKAAAPVSTSLIAGIALTMAQP